MTGLALGTYSTQVMAISDGGKSPVDFLLILRADAKYVLTPGSLFHVMVNWLWCEPRGVMSFTVHPPLPLSSSK